MSKQSAKVWIKFSPRLTSAESRKAIVALARSLIAAKKRASHDEVVEELRTKFSLSAAGSKSADRQARLAAGLVLSDLAIQGWALRVGGDAVHVKPPAPISDDRNAEKTRIRRQELVKRNAQLRKPSVQTFLRSMERTRLFNGRFVSIFSLMRDGRELATALRKSRGHFNNGWAENLKGVTDPYLQFVSSDSAVCPFTGLRLMDIWRYFRHTWTNQYTSVPGRTMAFLVRDQAISSHPVVGIGALSSPVMQLRQRDAWVGWDAETFLTRMRSEPTLPMARWLVKMIDTAINELYVDDLLEDGVISVGELSKPTASTAKKLVTESAEQRKRHHRFTRASDHKSVRTVGTKSGIWIERARTHLFRSKRALALADYLRARTVVRVVFGSRPTTKKLVALGSTSVGIDAIRKILKKVKSDRIGIAVSDITVCGAIQPYNAILGGKLVAMLAASPEVVLEYGRRYACAESEIASSMAGRSVVRAPNLVLLGTTSLYAIGSSQYNRISIPCERLGGLRGDTISYKELGYSKAFGTSQYSDETVEALVNLVQQQTGGQRVNSIFGEGASPKFRKVRQGLDLLDLASEVFLRHHRPRVVYAVSLIRNLRECLLGIQKAPDYLVPLDAGGTAKIAEWWRERWLRNRINSDEVLDLVAGHALVHPIRHGARVTYPRGPEQQVLFADTPDS
jgi:Domain of unknown function (DUF4338)